MTVTAHKARWAAGGGGLGSALAQIVVWAGAQYGLDMEPIEEALAIAFGGVGAFVGSYIGPSNQLR